jgi:hypothetical protein
MARNPFRSLSVIIVLAAAAPTAPARPAIFVECSAGPLIGIDRPLKGCSGDMALAMALPPFEAGLRAGTAYDLALGSGALRLDIELGLGSGLRAIVGGLVPFGGLGLPDPSGLPGARIPVEAAPWPDRFGLGATIADLPWRALGARMSLDAELVYTAYCLEGASALAGAAAFAAAVEARLALRFRWAP